MEYTTIEDVKTLFRSLQEDEETKAAALIPFVEDAFRQRAINVGKDLDEMIDEGKILKSVFVSTVVDVIGRTLNTDTKSEPLSQYSQSGLGYTVSGTYANTTRGIYPYESEYKKLGLVNTRRMVAHPQC